MLVLPELAMEQAVMPVAQTCERLIASLAVPFDAQGRQIHASLSIGVAVFPQDGRDMADLVRSPIRSGPPGPVPPGLARCVTGRR